MIRRDERSGWKDAKHTCAHSYTLPTVIKQVARFSRQIERPLRILDLGCGNGYTASKLAELGHLVTGVDVSSEGIEIARSAYPLVRFAVCSIYDDELHHIMDEPVDCVVSLDVIEHLLYPKRLLERSFEVLRSGGFLVLSTPYHGYLKNLTLAVVNGWDRHFDAVKDGGHIKFFSKKTLAQMTYTVGFRDLHFYRVGRLPGIWKSMVMVGGK